MRKFGVHLRMLRPGWRRFRPDWRTEEFCALATEVLGFDACPGEGLSALFPFGFAVPMGAEPETPEAIGFIGLAGGPSAPIECPTVLSRVGWNEIQGSDFGALESAGVVLPSAGDGPSAQVVGNEPTLSFILIRWDRTSFPEVKSCTFLGTLADVQPFVDRFNSTGSFP